MGFAAATAVERHDGDPDRGEWVGRWEVPDGWQQGRGAWGGVVVGGIVRSVRDADPDPARQVRSVSVHMAAPLLTGGSSVRAESLRTGSSMSTWGVRVTTGSDLVAHGVVITGRQRAADLAAASASWGTVKAPELPAWQDVPTVPTLGPGWPTFMQHVRFRVVAGIPMQAGPARCEGYVSYAEPTEWDAASLVALVDAWFPTSMVAIAEARTFATVSFSAHLLVDPGTLPPDEPLAFTSALSAAHDGFTSELRQLWTTDGRLAVENHQSIAIIR